MFGDPWCRILISTFYSISKLDITTESESLKQPFKTKRRHVYNIESAIADDFISSTGRKSENTWRIFSFCSKFTKRIRCDSYCIPAISAGLTIVGNVAIARGPALIKTPRFVVLNWFYIICKGRYWNLSARGKGGPIFYTCFTET